MKRFVASNWLPGIMAIIVVMVTISSGEQVSRWWINSQPVIEWHGVEVLTPTIKAGEELSIVYSATINRVCPADLRGFLIASDGASPVRYPVVAGGYAKPSNGPVRILVKIAVPQRADVGLGALLPGQYTYRTLATRYCPEGVEEDNSVPEAEFTINPPN